MIHGSMAFTLVVGGRRVHVALRLPRARAPPARRARRGPRGARARARDRGAGARRAGGAGMMPHAGTTWSPATRSPRSCSSRLRRVDGTPPAPTRSGRCAVNRWLTPRRRSSPRRPSASPAVHDRRVAVHRRGRVDAHADAEERRVLQDGVAKRCTTSARRHAHDAHRRRASCPDRSTSTRDGADFELTEGGVDGARRPPRQRADAVQGLRAGRGRRPLETARHVRVRSDPDQARLDVQAARRTRKAVCPPDPFERR